MNRSILFVLMTLLLTVLLFGGEMFFDNSNAIIDRLQRQGFENLAMRVNPVGVPVIYYENRFYRDELYGAAMVLAEAQDLLPDTGRVILTPKRRGLPICGLDVVLASYKAWVSGETSEPDAGWITLENVSENLPLFGADVKEPSRGRVDLTVYPSFSTYLGNYDDRFKLFFQLMPVLSTTLWRGAGVYVEGAFPIYNDVNYQFYRFKDYAQISKAAVNQMMRLPGDVLMLVSFGVFNPNRWGIGGEGTKLLFKRRLAIGYRFEYTGFLLLYKSVWNYSPMDLITSQAYAIGYITPLNMQVGISYNRYVMKDSGWLLEFSRNFRETSVGAFAGSTEIDKFGGLFVRFAFSRKKQPAPAFLRVLLPRYYEYSYRATNKVYTQFAPIQSGIPVYTGTQLTYLYANLTPNYLCHNQFLFKQAYDEKHATMKEPVSRPQSLWEKY
jgi:hypothetical protein